MLKKVYTVFKKKQAVLCGSVTKFQFFCGSGDLEFRAPGYESWLHHSGPCTDKSHDHSCFNFHNSKTGIHGPWGLRNRPRSPSAHGKRSVSSCYSTTKGARDQCWGDGVLPWVLWTSLNRPQVPWEALEQRNYQVQPGIMQVDLTPALQRMQRYGWRFTKRSHWWGKGLSIRLAEAETEKKTAMGDSGGRNERILLA